MDKTNENQDKVLAKDNQKIKKSAKKQKWSLKKKIIVIVGAILAFIIALIVIASLATSVPLAVSDEFVKDIQAGNASAAYDMMSNDAQTATSTADFSAMVDTMSPILTGELKNTDKSVNTETGTDPSAQIVYEIAGSDDVMHVITVNLVQENGNWKVLNFESKKE